MKSNRYFTLETESRKLFYQVPKQFMKKESKYYTMTSDSKLLYGILSDRNSLSIQNGWVDELERVYFIATIEGIMELTGWGNQKAVKHMKELRDYDLLETKRIGQGLASHHYLLQVEVENHVEIFNYHKKCENHTSRNVNFTLLEMLKSHSNNTNINNTDINNTTTHSRTNVENNSSELVVVDTTNKDVIEQETHLKLTAYQQKTVSKWNIDRLRKAIEIFKEQDGQTFALLLKIYKGDVAINSSNTVVSGKVSKSAKQFTNMDNRSESYYEDIDILERMSDEERRAYMISLGYSELM